jgi:hypothetical protein
MCAKCLGPPPHTGEGPGDSDARKRDDRHPAAGELDLASLLDPLRSAAFSARDPMLDLLDLLFAGTVYETKGSK